MPRKRKSLIDKLPDSIREAAVMRTSRVRSNGMTKYQKEMFLLFMPEISKWFFTRLLDGVAKGNAADKAMWAEMTGHIQRNKGININNLMQQNRVEATVPLRYSMDQIVRELQASSEMKTIDVGVADADSIPVET